MKIEIWMPVVGYEGYYEVSNLGNIKSNDRVTINSLGVERCLKGMPLKTYVSLNGYLRLSINKAGKYSNVYIHRLVANSFIENFNKKPQVNHINGIKTDNRVENLEWCTNSENQIHAFQSKLKTSKKGSFNPNSKLTELDVKEISLMKDRGIKVKYIANEFKINMVTVRDILKGITWEHVDRQIFKLR